jgi:hypothetical protein
MDRTQKLEEIRRQRDQLRIQESRLMEQVSRDVRVFEDRMHALLYRYVGFELFDPHQAYLLPKKTYVAQSGKYVLLGFSEQGQADEFFDAAYKLVTN